MPTMKTSGFTAFGVAFVSCFGLPVFKFISKARMTYLRLFGCILAAASGSSFASFWWRASGPLVLASFLSFSLRTLSGGTFGTSYSSTRADI